MVSTGGMIGIWGLQDYYDIDTIDYRTADRPKPRSGTLLRPVE